MTTGPVSGAQLPVRTEQHKLELQQRVRQWAVELGFSPVEQTKLVTATSELSRNMVIHAGGGMVEFRVVNRRASRGGRLIFRDLGPGIDDLDLALTDGYTTAGGLGLGLGGAKRLVNEFQIESEPGKGTCVTITMWRR